MNTPRQGAPPPVLAYSRELRTPYDAGYGKPV